MSVPQTPSSVNAGPPGAFAWKGLNWTARSGGKGSPGVSPWMPTNILHNADGTLTLRLTPAGGCEMDSTRNGFGYGDYWIAIETPLNLMGHGATWGSLFTYDNSEPTGSHNEIDIQETSSWGGGGAPQTTPHHWAAGTEQVLYGSNFPAPAGPMCTHMRWEKGKLSFWSYAGLDDTAPLIKASVSTTNVPTPRQEKLIINLWQFSGSIQPIDVRVHDFSFAPLGAVAPPPPPPVVVPPVVVPPVVVPPPPPPTPLLPSDLPATATLAQTVASYNALLDFLRGLGRLV